MNNTSQSSNPLILHTTPEETLCNTIAQKVMQELSKDQSALVLLAKDLPRIVKQEVIEKLFDVSAKTLTKWRSQGRIPYLTINGQYRYDLDKVIQSVEVPKKSIYK